MPKCDVRSNDYDKTFQITQTGRTLTFYNFECAIHAMAPSCARFLRPAKALHDRAVC